MKNLKKLASIILAMVMVFALATTAFAATVTLPGDNTILKGHSFTAYQIFKGTYSETNVLSDVVWGDGITSDNFLTDLQDASNAALQIADTSEGAAVGATVNAFAECTTAADVAAVLSANSTNNALAEAVTQIAYDNKTGEGTTLSSGDNTLADGYYLIVDTTTDVGEGGAYNAALLQVVGNVNITVKTDAPSVEKKVLEDDKYTSDGGYGTGYNDVADYNIGDDVPFKLIGTVPDMSQYDTYQYIFKDTLSDGLTLNQDSVHVYLADKKDGTSQTEITNGFVAEKQNNSLTVTFTDLKTVSGVEKDKYIIVEYTAKLNSSAVIGLDGNLNTVTLTYSNNPNKSGAGDNDTGNTPEDKVIVFTYELDTTKVDGQDDTKKLDGAEFKLHNAENQWVIVDTDGKVTGWADTEEGGSTLTSDASGLFQVIGLDDGTYYLKETKAPAGYNTLTDEITVVITAATANNQTWDDFVANSALTQLDVTADGKAGTGDTATGIAGITIANNAGSTLPETGGIGTTIFYVVGAVLVLGAVVLLVTKKRMNEKV